MRAFQPTFFALLLATAACGASTPESGTERGPCYPNGTCNAGLSCLSDLCVERSADGGAVGDGGTTDGGGGADGGLDGGDDTGVCGSDFHFLTGASECATRSCCASFDPCLADGACRACLDTGTGCSSDPLFAAAMACLASTCPTNFCGSGVGVGGSSDPVACALCVNANCCTELDACLGGTGEPEINACLACLTEASGTDCTSAPSNIQGAAADFLICHSVCDTSCS